MNRILIVDDEPDIRLILRSILESYGYHCDEATNGLEAIEKIDQQGYTVVILDYSMPFMNGLEVMERVAQSSPDLRPQMIMITANPDESIRRAAMKNGAVAVLSKPFDLDHILLTVERALHSGYPSTPCYHHPT